MTREEAIRILASSCIPGSKQTEALETLIPELKESEDKRMMREFNDWLCEEIECLQNDLRDEEDRKTLNMLCYVLTKVKDWLEKQKEVGIQWLKSDNVKNPDKPYIDKAGMFYTTDGRMCYASEIEKQKEHQELPLMNGDADLYFDTWRQEVPVPTFRQCFEEGMRYAQRMQKEQKHILKFKVGDKVHLEGDDVNILTITGIEIDRYLTAYGPILFGAEDIWERVEQKPVDYDTELKKCKDNPLYFYDKYVSIKQKPVEPSDDELERHQKELHDFKVFAAKQAKEHHISFVHDFEWNNFCAELLSYFHEQKLVKWDATINGEPIPTENHSVNIPLAEWSEDDSDNLERVENYLWMLDDYVGDDCAMPQGKTDKIRENIQEILLPWLKSLPKRFNLQPKQEWNEEDERMFSRCVKSIESSKQFADSDTFKKAKDNEIDWLENRIKSFRPVKQEWSKEDEKMLKWAIRIIVEYSDIDEEGSEIVQNWLESLRPQYHGDVTMTEAYKMGKEAGEASHWKPNDEQLRPLEYAIDYFKKKRNDTTYLESLYNDLKKL